MEQIHDEKFFENDIRLLKEILDFRVRAFWSRADLLRYFQSKIKEFKWWNYNTDEWEILLNQLKESSFNKMEIGILINILTEFGNFVIKYDATNDEDVKQNLLVTLLLRHGFDLYNQINGNDILAN